MTHEFQQLTDADLEMMFNFGVEKLKERAADIDRQLEKITRDRDLFKATLQRIGDFM